MPEILCLYDRGICPGECQLHTENVSNLNRLAPPLSNAIHTQVGPEQTSEILSSPDAAIITALAIEKINNQATLERRRSEITAAIEKLISQRIRFADQRDRNKCFHFNL